MIYEQRDDDKMIVITYDDIEFLLQRQESMTASLQRLLDKKDTDYIRESYISQTEDKALLNFIISPKQ